MAIIVSHYSTMNQCDKKPGQKKKHIPLEPQWNALPRSVHKHHHHGHHELSWDMHGVPGSDWPTQPARPATSPSCGLVAYVKLAKPSDLKMSLEGAGHRENGISDIYQSNQLDICICKYIYIYTVKSIHVHLNIYIYVYIYIWLYM